MKDIAKNLILESKAYGAALQPEIQDGGYNQDYEAHLISENVAQLLKDGVYLKRDEKDAQVFSEPSGVIPCLKFFILGTYRQSRPLCPQATMPSFLL